MKSTDDIVREVRAEERKIYSTSFLPHKMRILQQIDEKGYFTAGIREDKPLETPFALLMHPLPSEDDARMFHNHTCFELAYVYRGTCRNLRRDYEMTLREGDLLLMNPLAVHCLCTDDDETVVFNFLIPEETMEQTFLSMHSGNSISDFLMDYLHHIRTGADFLIVNAKKGDLLNPLIQQVIMEYYEKQPGYNAILQTGLIQIFVYMARRCGQSIQSLPLQGTSPLVRSLILYISQNIATVTLADMAREFSYHEKHLSRQMKKELGMGFTEFLQHHRLRNASDLLTHTNMPVSQIAQEVGYHNISHFYELFQKQYAMTPAVWRAVSHPR